jgi:ribonuclease HII
MKDRAKLQPYLQRDRLEAGCDEAGRGCLAGPVVAAAVILPQEVEIQGLNDSKKLSAAQRNRLRPLIEEVAVAFGVGIVSPREIDEINILNASFLAMHRALDELARKPDFLLIDGNRFTPYPGIAHQCVIGGDGKFLSIAAASILAKTVRDDLMKQLHETFPMYGWEKNKGYPAPTHREAIRAHGPCEHHRRTFKLLPDQLSLF